VLALAEDSQIVLPDSFVALFVPEGRTRPAASRGEMLQRYELCEDLACALTDRAQTLKRELDLAEGDVLACVHRGLASPVSGLSDPEGLWVLQRLAELLEWARPGLLEPFVR
jgi:hypothetical protein